MNQAVMERPTTGQIGSVTIVTPYSAYKNLAWIFDANMPDQQIGKLMRKSRTVVPARIVLARFEQNDFSNERLEALYNAGVHGFIIGTPPDLMLEQICARLGGYILADSKFGQLRLQGRHLYCGEKRVQLTEKVALIFRELLEARGATVSRDQIQLVYYGRLVGLKTHTLETQIYRLRKSLEVLGLKEILPAGIDGGYRVELF